MAAEKYQLLMLMFAMSFSHLNGLHEGDIVLTPEQQATFEVTSNPADPFSPQNAVVRSERSLWPNGRIPYVFSNLNSQAVRAIRDAMDDYRRLTCIDFVQRTNQRDYVRFFPGNGCFSYIGRIGGPQDISIGRGCESKGIVIHEIFHALGRWHEQSRPDRDMYVRILTQNIRSGTESNFEITSPSFVTTQGVPYDLGSIMHYRSRAFSRNGQPTILPRDPSVPESSLGQRNGLSTRDLQHVQTLYCAGSTNSGSWSSWSSWTSCSRTCNGGSRSRTRTCVGGTSCEGSNIQNQQCNSQNCPVPPSWSRWSSWGSCSASCGGGRQRRSRSCERGTTCQGIMNQFRDCNTQACPQPATWGAWGSWSSCSRTCQGGFRQRNRLCRNGNSCPGSSVESQACNTNIPCSTTTIGQWSSWSSCSAECGGGERYRTRQCSTGNCPTERQECNLQDCRPEPELVGLQYRGCWYWNVQRRNRIGSIERRTPSLSDNPRTRTMPVSKCGLAAVQLGYNIFALTLGGYCITGSNTLSHYRYYPSRLCRNGRGGFYRGWYLLDVYQVSNQRSFSDSAIQVINGTDTFATSDFTDVPTTMSPLANSTSLEGENSNTDSEAIRANSGYKFTYSIITIILAILFAWTML